MNGTKAEWEVVDGLFRKHPRVETTKMLMFRDTDYCRTLPVIHRMAKTAKAMAHPPEATATHLSRRRITSVMETIIASTQAERVTGSLFRQKFE